MAELTFLTFRDAVIADIKANLVTVAGQPVKPFLGVRAAPRMIDERWIKQVSTGTPSIHVSFIGSARRIERNQAGQLIGPWTLVAHIVCSARGVKLTAESILLDRMTAFLRYIEGRRFIDQVGAGPAQVTEIENMWDLDGEQESLAIGSVAWMQEVPFGVDMLTQYNETYAPMGVELPAEAPTPTSLTVDGWPEIR